MGRAVGMRKDARERLVELGAEKLADALIDLANWNEDVENRVERMTATAAEIVKKFKARVSGLKRRRAFVSWRESAGLERELRSMIEDLEAGVDDPKLGTELVIRFYETYEGVLENCDDSSGNIGDVYRYDAKNLFVRYASRCEEKEWIAHLVLRLSEEDDYGIGNTLIDCAAEYLPEETVRSMVQELWERSERAADETQARHWILLVESLARQLKDASLFEKARLAARPVLSTAACFDIAAVYFESGNAFTALSWLTRIPEGENFMEYQREQLLLAIHERMGNRQQLAKTAWRAFRRRRSKETLQTLLGAIGEEKREEVLRNEIKRIHGVKELSYADADFLAEIERWEDAEMYILERADQLDGDHYGILLPLAKSMESKGRLLVASVLYRALLDSILHRGRSKIYGHGVRYLKKLDSLAEKIDRWGKVVPHLVYFDSIRKNHSRKRAFWARYEE